MKELFNGNSQAIAQFLDSRYGCAVIAPTDNIIGGRLGNTAYTAKLIYRNLVFDTIICSQREPASWSSMILNDEVSANAMLKRATKHYTVVIKPRMAD